LLIEIQYPEILLLNKEYPGKGISACRVWNLAGFCQ